MFKYSHETCMNGMKQLQCYLPASQTAQNCDFLLACFSLQQIIISSLKIIHKGIILAFIRPLLTSPLSKNDQKAKISLHSCSSLRSTVKWELLVSTEPKHRTCFSGFVYVKQHQPLLPSAEALLTHAESTHLS